MQEKPCEASLPAANTASRIAGATKLCTIGCGGPLHCLYEVNSRDELQALLNSLEEYQVLGFGSNLLISDKGIATPVVKLGKGFRFIETPVTNFLRVGGAYPLMQLAREAARAGLSGLEFAAGIPASIGGALKMNAGAHGGEISERVHSVELMMPSAERLTLSQSEMNFQYRRTQLPPGAIVVALTLALQPGEQGKIEALTRGNLDYRRSTQPLQHASCGSVFKNPSNELSAGALIESLGLKGLRVGGAQISELHANWIINPERLATAADVYALIEHTQKAAWELRNIQLEPEVGLWGPF